MARLALPQYWDTMNYSLVQDFDDLSALTIGGSPTTAALDTTYYTTGTAGFRMTASGAAAATADFTLSNLTFGPPNPVSGCLRYWLPNGTGITSTLFYLSKTSNFTAGTWTSATLAAYEGGEDQTIFRTGWNNITFNRANFAGGTPTLLDDPANVFVTCRVRLEISKGPCVFDSVWLNYRPRPIVLAMFDDNAASIMADNDAVFGTGKSLFDYMNDRGIPGTMYVNGANVDRSGYLTKAQLDEMYAAGWDIGNHTYNHQNLSLVSEDIVRYEVSRNDDFIAANGWERGRRHLSYPNGEFTIGVTPEIIESMGFLTARSISSTLLNMPILADNRFYLWCKGVNSTVSAANMTAKVTEALQTSRMWAFYIHGLDAAEPTTFWWDPAKAKTLIDDIYTKKQANQLDALTISQYYNGLTNPRRAVSRAAV